MQISKLIYFYMYKNVVLVACSLVFQFRSGFSQERFFISIFISSYNLVLSTIQAFVALLLEHRKYNQPLMMIEPHKYLARLEYSRDTGKGGLDEFWHWIVHASWHGSLITVFVMFGYECVFEDHDGDVELNKAIG